MSEPGLRRLLEHQRLLVCVGTGGVGKTTVAATLAIAAARAGRRTLVLTIDPAKRLAGALGLESLPGEPTPLATAQSAALGLPSEDSLCAMTLDMKGTFDGLVERFASDETARIRILENPIYQHVSDALAGSAEYAAMEKVYELSHSGRFDLIVLDTPPSQNAVDFIDAPHRLLEFLDSRLVTLLIHPAFSAGRFGVRLFQGATSRILKTLEKLLGMAFLEDLSEFLLAFEDMSDGFKRRARRVEELLLGPEAAFILVAAPTRQAARNAEDFFDRLLAAGVPLRGLIVNRALSWPTERAPETEGAPDADDLMALASAYGEGHDDATARELARAALAAVREYDARVTLDRAHTQGLRRRAEERGLAMALVPELDADVHDTDGLIEIEASLFGRPDTRPRDGAGTASP